MKRASEPVRASELVRASTTPAYKALRTAQAFLSRWGDSLTIDSREDLAQEAAIIAWQRHREMRNPARFSALVRTVSRRLRYRTIAARRRLPFVSLDTEPSLVRRLPDCSGHDEDFEVAGVMVSKSSLLDQLGGVLGLTSALNSTILMSYYEGFSCSELAERYGMPEECVKVRIHRGRRRVRREFESRVKRSARHRCLK